MNNKGFAVTTLLYGLTIIGMLLIGTIMASIATTRNNMRDISDKVEEDLLNFTKSDNIYTVKGEYKIPITESGYYRVEAWGPQGSSGGGVCNGEKGSYATGIIKKSSSSELVFNIGECGEVTDVKDSTGKYLMYVDSTEKNNFIHGLSENTEIPNQSTRDTEFFVDGYKLFNVNSGVGKVRIKKIADASGTGYNIPRNNSWDNIKDIEVQIVDFVNSDKNQCQIMISYFETTSATKLKSKTSMISAKNYTINLNTTTNNKRINSISFVCKKDKITNLATKTIKINLKGTSNTTIYNGPYNFTTEAGIQLSAYQPSSLTGNAFPNQGNYYIVPLKSYNKAVTATQPDLNFSPIEISDLDGSNSQRWSIEKSNHNSNQYKIIETSTFRALDIQNDENYLNEKITAKKPFNTLSKVDSQHWIIQPNSDGTFSISTILPKVKPQETGFITIKTDRENEVGIGVKESKPTDEEKFIIYSLDFSSFSS